MTTRPTRNRHGWMVAAGVAGMIAGVAAAWTLHGAQDPMAVASALGDALRSVLDHGCAQLSCVLDEGAEHVFFVGKVVAALLALIRSGLAIL